MKNRNWKTGIALAAAVGAVAISAWAPAASAQYRVDTGNARDANNRIGSGGFNNSAPISNQTRYTGVTANDIVYGNVTGGKEFRGPLGSTDPRAFRGPSSYTNSDRFIRGSSGTPYAGSNGEYSSNANSVRPYYGESRNVPPPPGFVQQGFTGGYVPAPPQQREGSDLRLGNPLDDTTVALARP